MKHWLKSLLSGVLAATLLLPLSACESPEKTYIPAPLSGTSILLSAGFTKKKVNQSSQNNGFKTAMANMAFSSFSKIVAEFDKAEAKENLLYSPLSAALCLALIENGASGETLRQMENFFSMKLSDMNKALAGYIESLPTSEDAKLEIADSLWIRDSFTEKIISDFLQRNADYYDADVFSSPFDKAAAKDINQWVRNATDGMIDGILDEDEPIAADTVMYLINALMFDAKWQTEYEEGNITKQSFTDYSGKVETVDMMRSDESTYLQTDNAVGFSKYYKGCDYAFTALLPDEGVDVMDFAASLTGEKWLSMWKNSRSGTVVTKIPEFTYSTDISLTEILESLGMTDMFTGNADFSAMSDIPLSVSAVKQKTYIEVTRKGTKAAAVTWGEMKCTSAGPSFTYYVTLDRPFVYAITDVSTGLPIFIGVVTHIK